MSKAAATLLILLLSAVAQAQSLWKGSTFGMTPAQVSAAFPGASAPDKADSLHDGSIELLRLNDVEIVGHRFKARFFFKDAKLRQVTLSLDEPADSHDAELVYDSLIEILRAKYGTELSAESSHGIMESRDTTWLSGKTNITLYYNAIGRTDPLLNLIYQVRISSEADKI